MGRHTIVNPSTGRKVFKTGVIGRKVQQQTPIKKAAAANKPGPDKPKPKPKTSETTCEDMKLLKLEQFRSLASLLSISPNGSKDALITRISNNHGGGMLATLLMKKKKELAAKPAAAKPAAAKPVAAKPVAAKPVAAKPVAAKPVAAKPVAAKPAKADTAKPKPAKDTAKPKPAKADTAKPKPAKADTAKSAQGKPKPDAPKKTIEKKSYHGPGATKRPSPLWKPTKKGGTRPSARAMYDMGFTGSVSYDDKSYIMAFRSNGSPYWKPC
jgi:hypothetical protein